MPSHRQTAYKAGDLVAAGLRSESLRIWRGLSAAEYVVVRHPAVWRWPGLRGYQGRGHGGACEHAPCGENLVETP